MLSIGVKHLRVQQDPVFFGVNLFIGLNKFSVYHRELHSLSRNVLDILDVCFLLLRFSDNNLRWWGPPAIFLYVNFEFVIWFPPLRILLTWSTDYPYMVGYFSTVNLSFFASFWLSSCGGLFIQNPQAQRLYAVKTSVNNKNLKNRCED